MPEALGMYVAFGGCSGNTHGIHGTQDKAGFTAYKYTH